MFYAVIIERRHSRYTQWFQFMGIAKKTNFVGDEVFIWSNIHLFLLVNIILCDCYTAMGLDYQG